MGEDGARFKSYVDGQSFLLTPEVSIAMQRAINSDIMMVLDQCVPSTSDYATAKAAMELTHRWAKRSLVARGDSLNLYLELSKVPALRISDIKVPQLSVKCPLMALRLVD